MSERKRTISYELKDPYLEQLDEAAAGYEMSAGQYTKRLVIEALTNEKLNRLSFQMEELHEGLAAGIEQLLTQVISTRGEGSRTDAEQEEHDRETKEEVTEWINRNVRRQN